MGVEKGSAFLLKVGNGNVPATYETVAGMRTTQLSVNGEAVNITSKDSGGWRELLSGAGVRSVSVSASGGPGWRSAELYAQDAGGTAESIGRTAPRVVMG